ncbi:MAG: hypothetical protein WBM02_01030 [bacterium]
MRKLLLFIMSAAVLGPVTQGQMTVTIGASSLNATHALPWNHSYSYSETQYGIPATELAFLGTIPLSISKIGWYNCYEPPQEHYSLNVYIDQVPGSYDLSSLCTSQYANTNLVATGKQLTGSGFSQSIYYLVLDTPVIYTPGNTLIISVCDTEIDGGSPIPVWAANTFYGNGFYRGSYDALLDCNLATAESEPSVEMQCVDVWMTTWFEFSPLGPTYNLTMLPPGGTGTGSVSPVPGTTIYPENYLVTISAAVNPDSFFDYWEVDGAVYSDKKEETLLMNIDHTVQAYFKPFTFLPLPLIEDFTGIASGEIPDNWDRTHINWQVMYSNEAGGVPPEMKFVPGGSGIYRLIAPKLDGTTATNILLTFKFYAWVVSGGNTFRIQTSTDNGISWQDRWSISIENMTDTVSVNLDAVIGREFLLAFVFEGDTEDIYNLSIDDICVAEMRELDMQNPVNKGSVAPSVGKHSIPLSHEITLRALPSSTWHAFNQSNEPLMFDPSDPGSTTFLFEGYNIDFTGGTWAAGKWYAVSCNPSHLYIVNPANGVLMFVGATGQTYLTGIAYDEVNNIMYACTVGELYTIDRTTGAATLVGSFGVGRNIVDIAYGDGVLYAQCALTNSIYTVNTSTGATTLLGPTGIFAPYLLGMEYDKDHGRLFLALDYLNKTYLGEVDKTDGSVCIWFPLDYSVDGLAIPYGVTHPWELDRWEVDGGFYSNDHATTLIMDTDHSAQAFFTTTLPIYTLTLLAPGGIGTGSVSPTPGTYIYAEGQTAIISAAANPRSLFDYWELDGAFYSNDPANALAMNSDHTAQAFFTVDPNQFCSPNDIFSQLAEPDSIYIDSDAYDDFMGADDFFGLTVPIVGIDFWGGEHDYWPFGAGCAKPSLDYIIRFYEHGSLPGALVYEETITVTKIATTEYYFGSPYYGPLYRYTGMFSVPITLENGWVAVQAVDSGECIFSWVGAGQVTGSTDQGYAQWDQGAWYQSGGDGYNLAFCLLGEPSTPTPTEPPEPTPTNTAKPTATEPPEPTSTEPPKPTPTEPPEPTATEPPEPTPTEPPKPTPTEPPAPTPTVTPEPTPTETPEPTPSYPLGVRLDMPDMAHPGDDFYIIGYLDNPDEPLSKVPTFFILEVYGKFWFWPSWTYFDYPEYAEIDWENIDVPTGTTEVVVIPVFEWPDTGQDIVTGLGFYGAMLNPEMNDIMGNIAVKVWGYGPSR